MADLKPSEFAKPKVTLADHKKMVALGVKWRKADGKWGFKKKCANQKCENILKGTCYCSDTLHEAFYDVTVRSIYVCSTRCGVIVGGPDHLLDSFTESGWDWGRQEFETGYTKARHQKLAVALRRGDPDRLSSQDRKALFGWVEAEWENWDGDGDDGECSCEL